MSEFLEPALAIARQLCRDAIWDGDRCNWMTWTIDRDSSTDQFRHVHRTLRPDLCDGMAGVVLFLARCRGFSDERPLNSTLDGAIRQLLAAVGEGGNWPAPADPIMDGWLRGRAGVALSLFEAGQLLNRPDMCEMAQFLAKKLLHTGFEFTAEEWFDPLFGRVGGAGFAARLATITDDAALLARAVNVARGSLRNQEHIATGIRWHMPQIEQTWPMFEATSEQALLTASLAEVAIRSGDDGLSLAALAAVSGIQSTIPTEIADPAVIQSTVSRQLSWQSGVSGVGIPLLSVLRLATGDRLKLALTGILTNLEEQTISAISSMRAEPILDSSLHSGLSGIIEFLLTASRTLDSEFASRTAEAIGQAGIEQIVQADRIWPCGIPGGGESVTMSTGLAGIGHTYLRLHDNTIPSLYETAMPRPSCNG